MEDVIETIGIASLADPNDAMERPLEYVNYAFSTYLDSDTELIEASIIIYDQHRKIQAWIEQDTPFTLGFITPTSRNYGGLSLSITFPFGAFPQSPDAYIFLMTQPIEATAPVFTCYPYCFGSNTPIFDNSIDKFILTFSLLRTV